MKITLDIPGERYRVESDSGNVYHITYCGSGDADPDFVALWQCDCPAGRRGRECKHMHEFLNGTFRCENCGHSWAWDRLDAFDNKVVCDDCAITMQQDAVIRQCEEERARRDTNT